MGEIEILLNGIDFVKSKLEESREVPVRFEIVYEKLNGKEVLKIFSVLPNNGGNSLGVSRYIYEHNSWGKDGEYS